MHETLILRSSISSPHMRHVLFRGFSIAFIGILFLVLSGIYFPASTLKMWGWLIFFFSLTLLTWGLLPYRRLSRFQLNPDELVIAKGKGNGNGLYYISKGKKILSFQLESVHHISYIDNSEHYGIAFFFKKSAHSSIVIYEEAGAKKVQNNSRNKGKGDLFFPFFNRRSYEELIEC